MQLKQETSHLDARLGEREEVRAQADLAVVAEDRARERQQRALEVGERDVLVDREALDLVELRRVRGVVVAPVGAAGDDDVERRRLQLHRPHLHRRGVRAQDHVRRPCRRCRTAAAPGACGVVERVEVVVDGLDLGALGDAEAEAEEDVLDLAPHRGDQVQPPDRDGRRAGQRDVDARRRPAARRARPRSSSARARLDRRLERLARLVGRAADRAALLRRQLRDAAQQVRQLGLAAEVGDPGLLQLGGAGGGRDRRLALRPAAARCARSCARHPSCVS